MEVLELSPVKSVPAEFLPITQQSGIAKAERYAETFAPFMLTVRELSAKAANINADNPTALDAKLAREVRLAMVKNRTATANKKDESKAALLAESNLIQSLHNVVISTSQLVEADLTKIEKYVEIQEAKAEAALKAKRLELLAPYVEDATIFPLGVMGDQAFENLLSGSKMAFEAKQKELKEAEAKRLKEEAAAKVEQERIRKENEKLKKEAEAKNKIRAQRNAELKPYIVFIRDYNAMLDMDEEKYKKELYDIKIGAVEHYKHEAEQKKIRDAAAAKQKEEELKKAADAARLKAIDDARIAADKKAADERRAKEAAEKKAARAPDKVKILKYVADLKTVELPEVKSEEAGVILNHITEVLFRIERYAFENVEKL